MRKCVIFLFMVLSHPLLAHDPDIAFFAITHANDKIEIRAELPWTGRNALMLFAPELQKAKTKEAFLSAFEQYVRVNILIKDHQGRHLKLLDVKEERNGGHAHQNSFLLSFESGSINSITNTMMFNLYAHHKNIHSKRSCI